METKHRIPPKILERARELRQPLTPAEAALWRALRNRQIGFKFRRQHPINRFITDFYCAQAKLVIEIDGESHIQPVQEEYDRVRTKYLEALGYKVIRFTNDDVKYSIDAVVTAIQKAIENRLTELGEMNLFSPHPSPLPTVEREKENL